MTKIVSIKHNNTEFALLDSNSTITLNCSDTYINDNISASMVIPEYDSTYWTIAGDKPSNLTPIATYTGSEITNGYTCPTGVTMTGQDRGTEVGTYTAIYTPNNGYVWSDGTSESVIVLFEIDWAYLKFKANEAGSTIAIKTQGTPTLEQNFQYSTNGYDWDTFTPNSTIVTLTGSGDKIYLKGNNLNGVSQSNSIYYYFVMNGSISASGNIMSLIDNGACTTTTIPNNNCFVYLFKSCTSLTTALKLPATTLTNTCYYNMFSGCTSLTTPPELPATTLADSCYNSMFSGCTSLIAAPALPATTLASNCYKSMFNNCSLLTTSPQLPATTLAEGCYSYMFQNCTSLTAAPVLSATVLETKCYYQMFQNCRSLSSASELPATTLKDNCYNRMFYGCTSLTTAPELPATELVPACYAEMFSGCTSLTTSPQLSATALAKGCYQQMFYSCLALTTPPVLPAITLAEYCYRQMFCYCESLTTVPALPATTLAQYCYSGMFQGCTSLIVSDASGTGYDKAWRIPTSGTFTNTYSQSNMFYDCAGTRSSNTMAGATGQSYTYYTQNDPVS